MGWYGLSYGCMAVFLLGIGYRIYRQMTLPLHVRWEIYPVQHEAAARAAYGGSYMEELNWWEKTPRRSLFNEIVYMAPEILFLKGLWRGNRALWRVSFPFHFALYLMLVTFGLLLLQAVMTLWPLPIFAASAPLGMLMDGLIAFAGWSGVVLGNFGSLGLLYKRLADRKLRDYAAFSDYFHIGVIFLFFLSTAIACLPGDLLLEGAKAYAFGLLTGGRTLNGYVPPQSVSGAVAIAAASFLAAYIPLTHMSHMFMKYFLYHKVKWDDAPNRRGGWIEAAIQKNLELKPTWGAKHVAASGRKSWREIASTTPKEMK